MQFDSGAIEELVIAYVIHRLDIYKTGSIQYLQNGINPKNELKMAKPIIDKNCSSLLSSTCNFMNKVVARSGC